MSGRSLPPLIHTRSPLVTTEGTAPTAPTTPTTTATTTAAYPASPTAGADHTDPDHTDRDLDGLAEVDLRERADVAHARRDTPAGHAGSARAWTLDALLDALRSGRLPRDTEVLFLGLSDWTPAHNIPELWSSPGEAPNADRASPSPGSRAALAEDAGRSTPERVSTRAHSSPRRGSFAPWAIVLTAMTGLIAAAATLVLHVLADHPTAIVRLPKHCIAVAHVELKDWSEFPPFARALWPPLSTALTEAMGAAPPDGKAPAAEPDAGWAARLRTMAGIDLAAGHLREAAACLLIDETRKRADLDTDPLAGVVAVVTLAGKISPGSMPAIFEALHEAPWARAMRLEGSGKLAVIRVPGWVIGQADDGTIVATTSDVQLARARESTRSLEEASAETGLRGGHALEVVVEHNAIDMFFTNRQAPKALEPTMFARLARIERAHLGLDLGQKTKLELELARRDENDAKSTEADLRELLDVARDEVSKLKRDYAGEHAAMASARLSQTGRNVDLRMDFQYAPLDRGAVELAHSLGPPTHLLRPLLSPVDPPSERVRE